MDILKTVRKLEIRTRRLVEGLLQGAYHSVFKGRGIEFSEVREYMFGDDIRSIDWNVTARLNEPYVKEYIEERDLTMYIVFDMSGSSAFGMKKAKKQAAAELAASLMFAAVRNNDNAGLLMFSTEVERYLPPRKGRKHVLKLIRELVHHSPKNKGTDISRALQFLSKVAKKRSIVFIMSDFMDEGYEKSLRILSRRHDCIAINLRDLREYEIPDVGYIQLEDEESGEQMLVDTSDPEFQANYEELVKESGNRLKNSMRKIKVDMIDVRSDEPFELPLRRFFHMRARRMR